MMLLRKCIWQVVYNGSAQEVWFLDMQIPAMVAAGLGVMAVCCSKHYWTNSRSFGLMFGACSNVGNDECQFCIRCCRRLYLILHPSHIMSSHLCTF